jgi:hypothetical protein
MNALLFHSPETEAESRVIEREMRLVRTTGQADVNRARPLQRFGLTGTLIQADQNQRSRIH